MSLRLMGMVWGLSLGSSEKLVLLALADSAHDDDGTTWPRVETLAVKCSKSEKTIRTALIDLEGAGHLSRQPRGNRSTVYVVHPGGQESAFPVEITAVNTAAKSGKNCRSSPVKIADRNYKGTVHRETCINPFAGPAWDGWIEMRKKARKAPTARAVELSIAKLTKLQAEGHDPAAVLDQSTLRGWTGLFPLKGDYVGGNGSRPSGWLDAGS